MKSEDVGRLEKTTYLDSYPITKSDTNNINILQLNSLVSPMEKCIPNVKNDTTSRPEYQAHPTA